MLETEKDPFGSNGKILFTNLLVSSPNFGKYNGTPHNVVYDTELNPINSKCIIKLIWYIKNLHHIIEVLYLLTKFNMK